MKLFLASYRFGAHVEEFLTLTSGTVPGSRSRRIAVIANAADAWPDSARAAAVTSETRPLANLGFEPWELDLRRFRERRDELAAELDSVNTVWIRGGNTFVLRSQLARCGADEEIATRVREGRLVLAGYSAGACVTAPTLRGIEAADDPAEVGATGGDVLWDGLGLIDVAVIPHFGSILDEFDAAHTMAQQYEREHVDYLTLTDEQVILVDGDRFERL